MPEPRPRQMIRSCETRPARSPSARVWPASLSLGHTGNDASSRCLAPEHTSRPIERAAIAPRLRSESSMSYLRSASPSASSALA
jgi:hypothetical protein